MSTFVGKQGSGGLLNSQDTNALFDRPSQLIFSKRENSFLVADLGNNLIRKISMEGIFVPSNNKKIIIIN